MPRDEGLLEPACQGDGPARASHSASEGAAGLEIAAASDLVQKPKHSRGRCWNTAQRWALTATHQRHTMCCASFGVLWSRAERFVGLF